MNFWERYWFGPVAAVRPYLLSKLLLLIVGCDAIALMTERGSRYGLDGFSVSHFPWLDAIHPTPDATWYVAILMLVSFLALTLVCFGPSRPLQVLLTLLYTYSWAMDRHDSYLHHYMLTLIMTAMIFFPPIRAKDLIGEYSAGEREPTDINKGGEESNSPRWITASWLYVLLVVVVLEVFRGVDAIASDWVAFFVVIAILSGATILFSRTEFPVSPLTCAWGYRLLGATVGVIYVYTSLAKADAEWCGGHTLQKVGNTTAVLQPIESIFTALGGSRDLFWSGLATFVIPLELTIAASYFLAITQDQPERKRTRYWCCFAWVLAIGLHLNNEMMSLSIQWFGYYMMFLASMFFLPSRILMTAAMVFALPTTWLERMIPSFADARKPSEQRLICFALTIIAAALIMAFGAFADVPGATLIMPLIAVVVGAIGIAAAIRTSRHRPFRFVLSAVAAVSFMYLVVAQSDMRFDYYDVRGRMLQNLMQRSEDASNTTMYQPRHQEAIEAFVNARRYARGTDDKKVADLLCNLGITLRKQGEIEEARRSFQAAIDKYPAHFLAHYSLANNYLVVENFQKAIQHYEAATRIKSDFSDAYVNWGVALERAGQTDDAVARYRQALEIEPNASDIQKLLADALSAEKD